MTRLETKLDLLSPFLELLGSLEDTARVFDTALLTPEGRRLDRIHRSSVAATKVSEVLGCHNPDAFICRSSACCRCLFWYLAWLILHRSRRDAEIFGLRPTSGVCMGFNRVSSVRDSTGGRRVGVMKLQSWLTQPYSGATRCTTTPMTWSLNKWQPGRLSFQSKLYVCVRSSAITRSTRTTSRQQG
ncbi:hypothetical protein PI124_g20294 [Phytophthora idaei]|nr:hypothetical protein PI124_g20294 [Phytophthora idaei]